ncbi:epoxyqueuosine reductase QueH [Amygdalobacter nucleatus]|uniref:epoxyqueuosine reductase QueH n=1 Tax=Amygdalobacter nucleatus TaxID=3029274 RepID=UPI00279BE3A2|nr:epoxyqueuosine reductase QueH [Amygdalobacter nucleatus]WEG36399.1 epoxyqueuosine reductase QueH [Amygdalobacter nucleatus]
MPKQLNDVYREFQLDLAALKEKVGARKPRILLHVCCAPCGEYPYKQLLEEGFDVKVLFYNPNIHPIEEWKLRKHNVEIFSHLHHADCSYDDTYLESNWRNINSKFQEDHCRMCYQMRLDFAAKAAYEFNCDTFTTSLFVSPWQRHEMLKISARVSGKKLKMPFYYEDFRVGYRLGQNMAREDGLYRQRYCGCIFSLGESKYSDKIIKDHINSITAADIPRRYLRETGELVPIR